MEILKNLKNVSAGTWTRLAVLIFALITTALKLFGITVLPLENEGIENFLTVAIMVSSALLSYWKNNSFTEAAQIADKLMKNLQYQAND